MNGLENGNEGLEQIKYGFQMNKNIGHKEG